MHTHAPSRRRPLARRAAAAGIGIGIVLATTVSAGTAFAAAGFTDEQKTRSYTSDAATTTGDSSNPDPGNWSIAMMDVFESLRTDGEYSSTGNAAVSDHNDARTSEINLTASDEQRQRAIVDQYGDMSLTMADGLGAELGAIYTDAMAEGALPKTQWLLTKGGGRIGYFASTNPPKNYFDYDRPYLRLDVEGGELTYVDREGGDAWASTSGAYPSGHTSQAYWQGTALASLLPELGPQILARTAEAGNNRIVIAAHYPLDVISGRMMGQKIVAERLADPEFAALMREASAELRAVLEAECGAPLAECIAADTPYLGTADALAFVKGTLHYDFPLTGARGERVVVPARAESLLSTSHPELTADQRRQVLALTAQDSGHPLDAGEQESWQRLNLAAAMAAEVTVNADGSVSLGSGDVDPAPGDGDDTGSGDGGSGDGGSGDGGSGDGGAGDGGAGDGASGDTAPGFVPQAPVADGDDLPASLRGEIGVTVEGDKAAVTGLAADQWHFVYAYSTPTALGWMRADAAGTATVTLPAGLAAGAHRMAVLDASGALLGWNLFAIAADAGAAAPVADRLAATGSDPAPLVWGTAAAGMLLVAGASLVVIRRRAIG